MVPFSHACLTLLPVSPCVRTMERAVGGCYTWIPHFLRFAGAPGALTRLTDAWRLSRGGKVCPYVPPTHQRYTYRATPAAQQPDTSGQQKGPHQTHSERCGRDQPPPRPGRAGCEPHCPRHRRWRSLCCRRRWTPSRPRRWRARGPWRAAGRRGRASPAGASARARRRTRRCRRTA